MLENLYDLEDGLETLMFEDPSPAPEDLARLLHNVYPNSQYQPVETSRDIRINSRRIRCNDTIAFTDHGKLLIGKLIRCGRCADGALAVVEPCELIKQRPSGACRLRPHDYLVVVDIAAVIEPLIYSKTNENGVHEVIVPVALLARFPG